VESLCFIGTADIDTDSGVRSWPGQWFALGKGERSLFVTINRWIPYKMHLAEVKSCFVLARWNGNFLQCSVWLELCINLISGSLLKITTSGSERKHFLRRSVCFPPTVVTSVLNCTNALKVNSIVFSKRHYLREIFVSTTWMSILQYYTFWRVLCSINSKNSRYNVIF